MDKNMDENKEENMDEIKQLFKKIHNQLDASFTRAMRTYGLTCTQFDVLAYLAKEEETENTVTDISAHFGVRHTSVIHVLKILEKKGLVYRSASADARAKAIALTDGGRQLIEEVCAKCPFANEIIFAGFQETDLSLLKNMLKQVYKNLESDAFRNF